MQGAEDAFLAFGSAKTQQELRRKEIIYLEWLRSRRTLIYTTTCGSGD